MRSEPIKPASDDYCGCEPWMYCHNHRPGPSTTYHCKKCGKPRTKAEGGTNSAISTSPVGSETLALGNVAQLQLTIADQAREIEALKAERDRHEKRQQSDRNTVAFLKRSLASQSNALRSLNKGIRRLRKGRDNAIKRANEYRDKLCRYEAEHPQQSSISRQFLLTEVARLESELATAKAEIAIDDQLLEQRQRLVELFECPIHGQCIPYVIEQVEKLKARVAQLEPDSVHSLPPPSPPLHPPSSSPIPTLHTDSPPVKCPGSTS